MAMAYKLADLRALSDEELVELHDRQVNNVVVGLNYFQDELRRREIERGVLESQALARRSFWLTVASSFLAFASVVIAVIALLAT